MKFSAMNMNALREAHAEPKISLVVNEFTTESRMALIDGYVSMAIVHHFLNFAETWSR